jgi:hypothetical protein
MINLVPGNVESFYVPQPPASRDQKKGHLGSPAVACDESRKNHNPFFNPGAGLKPTVRLALMLITAPVCGFMPFRALRERNVNVPKPGT